MTSHLLTNIEDWLSSHRPEYRSQLNPPAQEYLFGALKSAAGIVLPEDFCKLYEWHDGQRAGTFEPLFQNLTFMTLMEMATIHTMHQQVAFIDRWSEDHWQSCWVPFLSNGGGDYLCVATATFRDIPTGSILWYDHETSQRDVIHKTTEEFLQDLYERMLTGRLELDA